jgi:hypothetical protein
MRTNYACVNYDACTPADSCLRKRFQLLSCRAGEECDCLERRVAKVKLRHRTRAEDINPAKRDQPRSLNRTLVRLLTRDSARVREHQASF